MHRASSLRSITDESLGVESYNTIRLLTEVSKGRVSAVNALIKSGDCDPNMADYDGRTGLHVAAGLGKVEVIRVLLNAGALVNVKDHWNRTPLDDAMISNQTECAKVLTDAGGTQTHAADDVVPEVNNEVKHSVTTISSLLLLHASAEGRLAQVKELLVKDDCHINSMDYDQRTALHLAASEGFLPIVRVLVDHGAELSPRDRWGNTPLAEAMYNNWKDVIEFLESKGAVNARPTATTSVYDIPEETIEHNDFERAKQNMQNLHKRGIIEKWALNFDEIHVEPHPFAKGSVGELYFAKWRRMKCVAKRFDRIDTDSVENIKAFANQISEFSHLRHPHLVMFLGACFTVDPPLLLMEYCAGGTLLSRFESTDKSYRIPKRMRRQIVHELALGMNCLHHCSPPLVHEDLKPSNVLLTDDMRVKVTDFGLKHFDPGVKRRSTSISSTSSLSTPDSEMYRFIAPEVFNGEEVSTKSDVYSFAMIVYWLYAGHKPFNQCKTAIKAAKLAAEKNERPVLSDIPAPMRVLMKSCWHQDPKERPSFSEIVSIVDSIKSDGGMHLSTNSCCMC